MRPYVRCFWSIFEIVGFILLLPTAFFMQIASSDGICIAIISKEISPDGRIHGVVLDCQYELAFGLGAGEEYLSVHLVRPNEEEGLTSTEDSCDAPKTAMLAVLTESLKARPRLHWVSSSHLDVMIPDGSVITLFNTNREGITVSLVFEKTDDQKQQRRNETSGGPVDLGPRVENINWNFISNIPFISITSGFDQGIMQ